MKADEKFMLGIAACVAGVLAIAGSIKLAKKLKTSKFARRMHVRKYRNIAKELEKEHVLLSYDNVNYDNCIMYISGVLNKAKNPKTGMFEQIPGSKMHLDFEDLQRRYNVAITMREETTRKKMIIENRLMSIYCILNSNDDHFLDKFYESFTDSIYEPYESYERRMDAQEQYNQSMLEQINKDLDF